MNNRAAGAWQQPSGYFGVNGAAWVPLTHNNYSSTLNRTSFHGMLDQNFSPEDQKHFAAEAAVGVIAWPYPLSRGSYGAVCDAVHHLIREHPEGVPLPRYVIYAEVGWPYPAFKYCKTFAQEDLPDHAVWFEAEGWLRPSEWSERFPMTPIPGGLAADLLAFTLAAYLPALLCVWCVRRTGESLTRRLHSFRARRAGMPLCLHCHYPLVSSSSRCPECGAPAAEAENR